MTKEIALKKLYKLHKGAGYFNFDELEEFIEEILDENEKLAHNTADALGRLHHLELEIAEEKQRYEV